ncbi:hypothetical protein KIPB_001167 [Kipferlia bialata]|uniref:GINS subunit domain-containing protein n=1 Tax=Kipferlia bialata TaxID=797122 RepID=A0A9K3CPX1_9EUKA|nr:hypothetical protein KIPB_001167 [Kipferlia bialata]|eukprot:g1167.t1
MRSVPLSSFQSLYLSLSLTLAPYIRCLRNEKCAPVILPVFAQIDAVLDAATATIEEYGLDSTSNATVIAHVEAEISRISYFSRDYFRTRITKLDNDPYYYGSTNREHQDNLTESEIQYVEGLVNAMQGQLDKKVLSHFATHYSALKDDEILAEHTAMSKVVLFDALEDLEGVGIERGKRGVAHYSDIEADLLANRIKLV